MKRVFPLLLLSCFLLSATHHQRVSDELDRVTIYLNNQRLGTWRDGDEQVMHLDSLKDGDTITFRAHTDLGGLGSGSIDIEDDKGTTVDRIVDVNSLNLDAQFTYVYNAKHINDKMSPGTNSLVVKLNFSPERDVPARTIAYIAIPKKQ